MRILQKVKDGGPQSTVTAYFLCEFKSIFSIALLRFDKGSRENYHSHAFNALSILISGRLTEFFAEGGAQKYKRLRIKSTPSNLTHKVYAYQRSWVITLRGPWAESWTEVEPDGTVILLGHGRKIIGSR